LADIRCPAISGNNVKDQRELGARLIEGKLNVGVSPGRARSFGGSDVQNRNAELFNAQLFC